MCHDTVVEMGLELNHTEVFFLWKQIQIRKPFPAKLEFYKNYFVTLNK